MADPGERLTHQQRNRSSGCCLRTALGRRRFKSILSERIETFSGELVMPTPAEWLNRGLACHRAGDLDGAESFYRQVLQIDPDHAAAWHLLGVVATHRGRPEQALELIGRALARAPREGAFHLNLGVAYQALGRMEEAET